MGQSIIFSLFALKRQAITLWDICCCQFKFFVFFPIYRRIRIHNQLSRCVGVRDFAYISQQVGGEGWSLQRQQRRPCILYVFLFRTFYRRKPPSSDRQDQGIGRREGEYSRWLRPSPCFFFKSCSRVHCSELFSTLSFIAVLTREENEDWGLVRVAFTSPEVEVTNKDNFGERLWLLSAGQ